MTGTLIRGGFGLMAFGAAVIGAITGDLRWYVASGFAGTLWWLWDFVADYVLTPVAEFLFGMLRGDTDLPPPNVRPTAGEMIELLERRLQTTVSADTDVPAALQLADFYRVFQKDPERALAVIESMKVRYPDDERLKRYSRTGDERRETSDE
jgi:hypothetical protein